MLQDNRRWRTAFTTAWSDGAAVSHAAQRGVLALPLTAAGLQPGSLGCGPQFGFGPVPGEPMALLVAGLHIIGMPPGVLERVQVLRGDRVVYQLDSVRDARGVRLPAGELLLAMARMQGSANMVIDTAGLDLAPATTRVWLTLSADVDARRLMPQVMLAAGGPTAPQAAS